MSKGLQVFLMLLLTIPALAQDNVGIGTAQPHPSAILEITDSSRGVLIPRTTTDAIDAYINSLTPSPGVADGLLVFDTNLTTYMFYDAVQAQWKSLVTLVGPTGMTGPIGPTGPTGSTGLGNDWRDSTGFDELVLKEDTCGDWFLDTETGKIWWLWCDTLGGGKPRMWIDTVLWDNPIGELAAPDERVYAANVHANSSLSETMANDTTIVVMKLIPGLQLSVRVEVDEICYVWWSAHGTTSKALFGRDMSYAQYDADVQNAFFYRASNQQHIVTIGPNGPESAPGNFDGFADRVGWYLSGQFVVEGELTPGEECFCGHPTKQKPWCSCPGGPVNGGVSILAGNRYSGSSTTSTVILADEPGKENIGHLSIFAIWRRHPGAEPRKR
jgi:hypothetical protein